MKRTRILCLAIGLLALGPSSAFAQIKPADAQKLAAATAALAQSESYSWTTQTLMEGGADKAMSPISGKFHAASGVLRHSKAGDSTVETASLGGKQAAGVDPQWKPDVAYTGGGEPDLTVRELLGTPAPHEELGQACRKLKSLEQKPDGSYHGEMDSAEAKALVLSNMKERAPAFIVTALKSASCTVHIKMANDLPAEYELHYTINVAKGFLKKTLSRTTKVRISAIGWTTVELPAGAKSLLAP